MSWRSGCSRTRRKAVDLNQETPTTKKLYGLDQGHTREFGTRLLLARRMVERGVRFVQVYSGGGPISMQWDAHKDLKGNHEKMAGHSDQPIGALLDDLKGRGLLEDTLVIWGAEFGAAADLGERQRPRPQSVRFYDVVRRRRR